MIKGLGGNKQSKSPLPQPKEKTSPVSLTPEMEFVKGKDIGGKGKLPEPKKLVNIPVIPQAGIPEMSPDLGVLKGPPRLEPEQHLGLVGPSRGGKSTTLLYLLGSKEKVTYITVKATDKVPEHWTGILFGSGDLKDEATLILDYLEERWLAHRSGKDKNEEWIVIDEAIGIRDMLFNHPDRACKDLGRRISGLITQITTAGLAVGLNLALLSQTPNATDLGISAALLDNFTWVVANSEISGFNKMVKYFQKMTNTDVPPAIKEKITRLSGFWQLWGYKGQPVLGQCGVVEIDLKPLVAPAVALQGVAV
jgi:hypothetical protein